MGSKDYESMSIDEIIEYRFVNFVESIYRDPLEKLKENWSDIYITKKHKKRGSTLHAAIYWAKYDIAKFMLDKGMDVNIVDRYGWTPLHYAVLYARMREIELLLKYGADMNKKNNEGTSALEQAKNEKNKNITSVLEEFVSDIDFIGNIFNVP